MKLEIKKPSVNDDTQYIFTVSGKELRNVKFNEIYYKIMEDSSQSDKISDKLYALTVIAKKIEQRISTNVPLKMERLKKEE